MKYQGDIKKVITPDGSTFLIKNGDALRDRGIENEVMYGLFATQWFGNEFLRGKEQKLESRFVELCNRTTTMSNMLDIESEVKNRMSTVKQVKDVGVEIKITTGGHKMILIDLDLGTYTLSVSVRQVDKNFEAQVLDPAYKKVSGYE